jgi:hypothetical protein
MKKKLGGAGKIRFQTKIQAPTFEEKIILMAADSSVVRDYRTS